MKKKFIYTLLLAFSFSLGNSQADAIEKYFSKYYDDESFSTVYVSPKMFQMVTKVLGDEENAEVKDLIQGIKGLRILRSETNPMTVYKEALNTINTREYEILMTVRDKEQNLQFLTKESGDIISELLLLAGGDEEFIMLSFIGNINLNSIAKLAKSLDIDGAEYLEQLEDK